jgi:hypothetical protein
LRGVHIFVWQLTANISCCRLYYLVEHIDLVCKICILVHAHALVLFIVAGGLPTVQVFSSLTASPEARMAAAAAGTAMPLSRLSSDDAAGLMAGVMRSFTREMADTPLLLVPQVCFRLRR